MSHPTRWGNFKISPNAVEGKAAFLLFLYHESGKCSDDDAVYASDGDTYCVSFGALREMIVLLEDAIKEKP